jgi:hypothetical protein
MGSELSTGVEMDTTTFERLPDIHSQMRCTKAAVSPARTGVPGIFPAEFNADAGYIVQN